MRAHEYDLERSLGYMLTLTSRVHERRLEQRLADCGLTRSEYTVLFAIGRAGRSQPSEIAYYLHVDRPVVSRVLGALARKGLTMVGQAGADKRVRVLGLSLAGQEKLNLGIAAAIAVNDLIRAALNEAEREAMRDALSRIRGTTRPKIKSI